MATRPQKFAAQQQGSSKWVSGWYVEIRQGNNLIPHIYTDSGGWTQIDASTLRPLPTEGDLF